LARAPILSDVSHRVGTVTNSSNYFPRIIASNLDGERFELPRDFAGALNLVVVVFRREQQRDADSWMPWLRALERGHDDCRVYELPTMSGGYVVMRPFIDRGMRRGIADLAARSTTIPLYVDKAWFREALGIVDESRIVVLIVDRRGRVYACEQGAFAPDAAQSLERRLTALTEKFQTSVG
jgi:hypothetical protein